MTPIKEKIKKLFAQADSEKLIGNREAASAYRKKANSLLRTNNLTKKELNKPETFNVAGEWICSCGAEISLDFYGLSAGIAQLAKSILAPHQRAGHILTRRA